MANSSGSSRRSFLSASAAGLLVAGSRVAGAQQPSPAPEDAAAAKVQIRAIASGNGRRATAKAVEMIVAGSDALEACVAGVNIVEADPNDTSVGYGGLPNEAGVVQLDAAVMHGPTHQAGAVACIEGIKLPSQVALLVMKRTDHVLLVGRGATEFAKAHGFVEENLLTERARKAWLRWKETLSDQDDWLPPGDGNSPEDSADGISSLLDPRQTGTIHCAAMDAEGNISCCTTTSGLAFKIPGRVGDSPIIGAGLYVDNQVGSCGSTGRGEANLQNQSSFAAVELMRSGMTPQEAGLEILRRVARHTLPRLQNDRGEPEFGLQFYLMRKDGLYAGVTMRGANAKFAVSDEQGTRMEPCVALY